MTSRQRDWLVNTIFLSVVVVIVCALLANLVKEARKQQERQEFERYLGSYNQLNRLERTEDQLTEAQKSHVKNGQMRLNKAAEWFLESKKKKGLYLLNEVINPYASARKTGLEYLRQAESAVEQAISPTAPPAELDNEED